MASQNDLNMIISLDRQQLANHFGEVLGIKKNRK